MRGFNPETEPNGTEHIRVSDLHQIYDEEWGTPEGRPMLFVHGGPHFVDA